MQSTNLNLTNEQSEMQTQATNTELERELANVDEQISHLDVRRKELRNSLAIAKSAFKIGDIITWNSGKGWRKGRVVNILPSPWNWTSAEPAWDVVNIRKNGTEGCYFTVYDSHAPEFAKIDRIESPSTSTLEHSQPRGEGAI